MVERGEEHDRGVGDRFGEVLASYRHVDRAEEGKVAEGEGEQLHKYVAGAENVRVVRAVEAAVTTSAVARREDEAAAHVMHALATTAATTLDARRRRHNALHPNDRAMRQAVAPLASNVALQTGVATGARVGAGADVVITAAADRLYLLFGAEDAQTDVPDARFRERHVYVSGFCHIRVHIRSRDTMRADATAARGDV